MASTIRNGAFSPPPLSSTTSYTISAQSRLNIVSRLAIDGRAKQGDGANIKLFLKLIVPVDSVTPGQIVPLFPENDVKLKEYQVHPLDSNSVPYNFSSSTHPLLQSAARALNLPARSTKSYLSLFDNATSHLSSATSSSPNGSVIPVFEIKYTGYVLISGYNVCFVLPKEFPPKYKLSATTDSDGEGLTNRSGSKVPFRPRRGSIGERTSLQFMVALEVSVPYVTKPPKAPYLLSIPIPRCLSNTVKVRIFQPRSMTTSFQSLSSDDEPMGWELATEPHVARVSPKLSRSSTYTDFADDESSESSTAENCIIHGTFTSSDYLRIRWATPLKNPGTTSDGRRRVGVTDVQGNLTCTILEKTEDGVKVRLDYQGTCTGVWFPGVATMLGLDVALDKRSSHCNWPSDTPGRWSVDGDGGFTGFSVASSLTHSLSREPSLETPQLTTMGLPPGIDLDSSPTPSRASSMSSSSLMRAPLPHRESTPEYSFEDSAPTTPGMLSSVAYTHSSNGEFGLSAQANQMLEPPTQPITIHVNMNELQPYPRNKFSFNVSGTIIVLPSLAESDVMTDPDTIPIVLPMLSVQKAETQTATVSVRSLCEDSVVEVVSGTSASQFEFGKKTVLRSGAQTKCGSEGAIILVKRNSPRAAPDHLSRTISQTPRTPATTIAATETESSMILARSVRPPPIRDGPLVIPWVTADVFPNRSSSRDTWSYSVKLELPTPVDAPTEWLEFGLAMPPSEYAEKTVLTLSPRDPPSVSIACASIDGVPVRFETFKQLRPELDPFKPKEEDEKTKWLTWVRVRCGQDRIGTLRIDYSLRGRVYEVEDKKGKKRDEADVVDVNVFLPMFSMPVASYDVDVKKIDENALSETNAPTLKDEGDRFHNYNLEPFSYQHITFKHSRPSELGHWQPAKQVASRAFTNVMSLLPTIAIMFLLVQAIQLRLSNQRLENQIARFLEGSVVANVTDVLPLPTSTSMAPESTTDRWWYGGGGVTHTLVVPETSQAPVPISTPIESEVPPPPNAESKDDLPPALVPSIYVPISWLLQQRIHFEQMKQYAISSWVKMWRVLDVVLNWPLGPSSQS